MGSADEKNEARKKAGWLLIVIAVMLGFAAFLGQRMRTHDVNRALGAIVIPILIASAGLFLARKRKIAGWTLVLSSVVWGIVAIRDGHRSCADFSALLVISAPPVAVALIGLYIADVVTK